MIASLGDTSFLCSDTVGCDGEIKVLLGGAMVL